MPMPMTMEMNITEKMVRCPTVRVTMPMDQASVTASTPSIRSGLPTRPKARRLTQSAERRKPAVLDRRRHLVVGHRRSPRRPRLHVGEDRPEVRDDSADDLDGVA